MKGVHTALLLACLLPACSLPMGTGEHPAIRDFRQQMDASITQMEHLHTEAGKRLAGNSNYDQALHLMQQNEQQATQVLNQIWAFLGQFEYDLDKAKHDPLLKDFERCEGQAQTIGTLLETQGAILPFAATAAGRQEPDHLLTLLDHEKQILQASREARDTCSRLPVERLQTHQPIKQVYPPT